MEEEAHGYLGLLRTINSAAVVEDLDMRTCESRRGLESAIRAELEQIGRSASRALERAQRHYAAGDAAVQGELARLENILRRIAPFDESAPWAKDSNDDAEPLSADREHLRAVAGRRRSGVLDRFTPAGFASSCAIRPSETCRCRSRSSWRSPAGGCPRAFSSPRPSSARHAGGTGRREVVYLVFPRTRGSLDPGIGHDWPRDVAQVMAASRARFQEWGGVARLKACAAKFR